MDDALPAFVVDMNCSPKWVDALQSIGCDAIHWSMIGDARTPDPEIMVWANANKRAVFTADLDFGTLLVLTRAKGPSVLQIRTTLALPRHILPFVRLAIERHAGSLCDGALLILDESSCRLRLLPF